MIAVQIFDQRKFKRRDQGFLGVVNVRVSDVLDLELGGHGESLIHIAQHFVESDSDVSSRNAYTGP